MIENQRSILILFCLVFLQISCNSDEKNKSKVVNELEAMAEEIKLDSDNPELYIKRAEYYKLHKAYDEAIVDYHKAIELNDSDPTYFFDLADTHIDYLDVINARRTMDAVVDKFPNDVDARLKMARLLIILKEYDQVALHLQHAKVIDPYNAEIEYTRGIYFLDQDRADGAFKAFQAAVELDDQLIDGWLALGEIASNNKDDNAQVYFNNALNIEPDNIQALHAKAFYLQNINKIDDALENYTRINEIDSTYEWAYFNRAILLLERNQLDESERLFKVAIVNNPNMVEAFYYLGIIREKQKRYEEALRFYRDAAAIDPNYEKAIEAIEDLDRSN